MEMWDLDIGRVLNERIVQDPTKKRFGHLPQMVTNSRASIGALLASSFCERILTLLQTLFWTIPT